MAQSPDKRSPALRTNSLLALGSAAVLTVYTAGFARTRAAAQALEEGSDARRVPPTSPPAVAGPVAKAALAPATPIAAGDTGVVAGAPMAGTNAASASVGERATGAAPGNLPAVAPTVAGASSATTSAVESKAIAAPTATPRLAADSPAIAAAPPAAPATPSTVPATAPATAAPVPSAPVPAPVVDSAKSTTLRDGTYTGWGTSRHGDIEATVVIEQGKITGAVISRCLTRYSCSWIAHLQAQVVARQSPEVDNVSGATQSANAFYYAVVEALAKAK